MMTERRGLAQLAQRYRAAIVEAGLGVYAFALETKDGEREAVFFRTELPENLYSATKLVTAIAVGLALDEGLLDWVRPVLEYFPEQARALEASWATDLRLRHLLSMQTGQRCFWFGALDEQMDDGHWVDLFWKTPFVEAPGQSFFYSNSAYYLLAVLLERVTGQSLRAYLMDRLFRPLGIVSPCWGTCPDGVQYGGSRLYLTLTEFGALAKLMLQAGQWNGRRLISEAYYREMVSLQAETRALATRKQEAQLAEGYGYGLWLGRRQNSYRADGKYGQFALVYPEEGLAVTILAHEEARPYELIWKLEQALEEWL